MKRTVFQHPELRDANDVIIQEGTYGKNSPLANSDNTGGFDYINNNLEALYDMITGSKVYVDREADLPATGDVAAVYIASDTGVRYYWDPSAKKYVKSESDRKLVNETIAARDAALASQQAAAASEETAKSARNSAEGSATAAGNSATEAASFASSAGRSATAAQAAASTATTQAENASSSAALASASQTAAKTSETRAAESAKEAARSASQASAYQINADWKETDTNAKAYIKNKPDVVSKSDLNNATAAVTNQLTSKIDKMSETFNTTNLTVTSETSVPTANAGNSSKAIANTEFVAKSLAKLVDSAPESLNTLNELAKALGNNPNFASTVLNELAKKLNSTEADDLFVKRGGTNIWNALHNNTTGTLTGLTNAQWGGLGFFIRYFAGGTFFEHQPSTYGQLWNIPADNGNESTQLFIEQNSGRIFFRGGNASIAVKDQPFKGVAYFNSDNHLVFPNGAEMWIY